MTSKCGLEQKRAHEQHVSVSQMFLSHLLTSSVIYITEQTHGNMESFRFIQWIEKLSSVRVSVTTLYKAAWLTGP